MRSIEGNAVVGQSLTIFIQPPGSRDMRFRPTVLVVEPKRELRWKAASGFASEQEAPNPQLDYAVVFAPKLRERRLSRAPGP